MTDQNKAASSEQDERASFEAWAKAGLFRVEGANTLRMGWYYFDKDTDLAWDGWKSRAAQGASGAQGKQERLSRLVHGKGVEMNVQFESIDTPEFRERLRGLGATVSVHDDAYKMLVGYVNRSIVAQLSTAAGSGPSNCPAPVLIQALEIGDERETSRWFDIHPSEVPHYTEEGYKIRRLYTDSGMTKKADERDAARYRWVRERGGIECILFEYRGNTSEAFDAYVDKRAHDHSVSRKSD